MLTASELDQACDVLIEHEGLVPWLYCDSKGFPTVGVGDKCSSDQAATMPFIDRQTGLGVDGEAKRIAWARVCDAFQPGANAGAYATCSDLRLPVDFCRRRLVARLKGEFLPAIEVCCPQAAAFPVAAKLALVDIAYNVGAYGFGAFKQLIVDCNSLRFTAAADHVHTKKEGEDPCKPATWGKRNTWRRVMMLTAAKEIAK